MSTEKKKINYNGMELECIDSGYWPDGVTLVLRDRDDEVEPIDVKVICLHNGIAFYADGESSAEWGCWAILPPKPAPRRLTNREAHELCKNGYSILRASGFIIDRNDYYAENENDPLCNSALKLRAPNSDEWLEPTSDLLESAV